MWQKVFITVFLALFSNLAQADFIGFRLDNEKSASFDFELKNNLVIVPVKLNDSVNLRFILDTGVRTTLINECAVANQNISQAREVSIRAFGGLDELNAVVLSNVSLSLPGISGRGLSLLVLDDELLNLSEHLGTEVHGVLGYDFLRHFVIEINYHKRRINVFDSHLFKAHRKYERLPLFFMNERPYLDLNFEQIDGSIHSGRLLVDTGAGYGLLLELAKETDVILPEKNLPTIVGWGLGGALHGRVARLPKLKLNEFVLKNVITSYVQGLENETLVGDKKRVGAIGAEVLSRFNIILDYGNAQIYFRKNSQFKRKFDFNHSGIGVAAEGENFDTFKIAFISDYSPAIAAGLSEGDILLAVDGKGAGELTLDEINTIFRDKIGDFVHLIILRDEDLLKISFKLSRVI